MNEFDKNSGAIALLNISMQDLLADQRRLRRGLSIVDVVKHIDAATDALYEAFKAMNQAEANDRNRYVPQDWDIIQVYGRDYGGDYAWLDYVALRGADTIMITEPGLNAGFIGYNREPRPIRVVRNGKMDVVYENEGQK